MRKTLSPAQKKKKGSPSPGRTTRSTAGAASRTGTAGAGGSARRRATPAAVAASSKLNKPQNTAQAANIKTAKQTKTVGPNNNQATGGTNVTATKAQPTTNKKTAPTLPAEKTKVQVKSKLRKVIAGKVRPTAANKKLVSRKKPLSRRATKKEKEDVNKEPVEVVIHVKKPKSKIVRSDSRTGVSSGKIGKRKTTGKLQQQEMKKKLFKKLSGKMEEKLESVVNTILEVAVVAKKVVPKNKSAGNVEILKSKEKEKKERKKGKVKEEIKKVEIKEEKKEKELKLKDKEVKAKKDLDKKEVKSFVRGIKEDKELKKELVEVPEDKKVKEEIKEEVIEIKEEAKVKESKPKNKKPKKENEDCVNKSVVENPNSTKIEEITKSPVSKESLRESTSPKAPAEMLVKKKVKLKDEEPKKEDDTEQKKVCKKKVTRKGKPPPETKKDSELNLDESKRRMKLFGFWEGPKRHREASLNALAKVHCLYENESRGAMMEMLNKAVTRPRVDKKKGASGLMKEGTLHEGDVDDDGDPGSKNSSENEEIPKRTLRSAPGMRSVGRCWDVEPLSSTSPSPSSSSADESSDNERPNKPQPAQRKEKPPIELAPSEETKKKEEDKPPAKKVPKRRKRCELMMDLKDMVVRKRMASLNASAMLAASYSMEKRTVRSGDDERRRKSGNRSITDESTSSTSMEVESSDDEVIVSGSSKKVAVIVNQDTDVTITGLYVNSTTRSTRHCSITGMQYRISSTSHTQTEATAVTTETVIHTTDHVSVSHSVSP